MFKNIHTRLVIISSLTTLALLIALPRIPITIKNRYINLDSYIGGYVINAFNGRINLNYSEIKQGLDILGGVRIVLNADMSKIAPEERQQALEAAAAVISRRVDFLGVSEPSITTSILEDTYRIIVEIPGVTDVDSAVELIGQTAQLKFKQLPSDVEWTEDKFQEYFFNPGIWEDTSVTGADLRNVAVVYNSSNISTSSSPTIQLIFTNEGRRKFTELAKNNIDRPVAIFLDDEQVPISMPVVSPDLANDNVGDPIITGNFTLEQANSLSVQIRAGSLPVPVSIVEQKNVGASLGQESINRSLFAGLLGMVFVFAFMLYKYGRLGFYSCLSLIIYSILTIAIYKMIPVVLTLPGIAGFILSVGMAVDANILVFERIKEEIKWNKPTNLAIDLGFDRAFSSIKDSNISSLITSGLLFYFGSGPIRGFALTLAIGVFISLFVSLFVTRTFVDVFGIPEKRSK